MHVARQADLGVRRLSRLSQIFSNVLHNAAEVHRLTPGNIELSVARRSRQRCRARPRQRHRYRGAVPAARVRGVHAGLSRARSQPGRAGRRPRRRVRRLVELHQGEVNISSDGAGRRARKSTDAVAIISEGACCRRLIVQALPVAAERQAHPRRRASFNADAAEVGCRLRWWKSKARGQNRHGRSTKALACFEEVLQLRERHDHRHRLAGHRTASELAAAIRSNKAMPTAVAGSASRVMASPKTSIVLARRRFPSSLRQARRSLKTIQAAIDDSRRQRTSVEERRTYGPGVWRVSQGSQAALIERQLKDLFARVPSDFVDRARALTAFRLRSSPTSGRTTVSHFPALAQRRRRTTKTHELQRHEVHRDQRAPLGPRDPLEHAVRLAARRAMKRAPRARASVGSACRSAH